MHVPIDSLVTAIRGTLDLPLLAIGSGGSLTVADFAASLHRELAGAAALAQTPLDAVASNVNLRRFAVTLATASGGNPDVIGSFKRLASREARRLLVLCLRSGSPLARHAERFPYVDFIELDAPSGRDGFLATNSLIASTVLLTRAYSAASGTTIELPKTWEELTAGGRQPDVHERLEVVWHRETLVVLHGAHTRSAAVDIESKLTEAALKNVWTADFRHFAHGRHHWLAKRGKSSAVVAFITPSDSALAKRTLALIPHSVPVVREQIPFTGPVAALAALARVMYITGSAGTAVGIDPGRPGVPAFGSRIYRLNAFPSARGARNDEDVAISRKTFMNVERLAEAGVLEEWRSAYRNFSTSLSATLFRGVVLDYDGTMCSELDRYRPLSDEIVAELDRLLRGGIYIGVATGRGKSVRQRLREALAREHWARVVVGYYNGGDVALLDEDGRPHGGDTPSESLAPLVDVIRRHRLLNQLASFEFRVPQVKVEAKRPQDAELVWDIVQQLVTTIGSGVVSLLRSSHSMDIVASGVSKLSVVRRLTGMIGDPRAPVLCIGDRGRYPGNDHLLLATSYGLSVDESAPNVESGWNLAPLGHRGVDACIEYLRRLRVTQAGVRFFDAEPRLQ